MAVVSHSEFSAAESQTPALPPSLGFRPAPVGPAPPAGWATAGRLGWEGGAGEGCWGGLFSLQFMNKQNYSERPQPESPGSKAYFEFIWCAIHYLLKMKRKDFYCTELFTHSHLFKCFLFKANYKKKKIKKKKRTMKKEKNGTIKQKQPRATSMRPADWRLVSPAEVPWLPSTLCF